MNASGEPTPLTAEEIEAVLDELERGGFRITAGYVRATIDAHRRNGVIVNWGHLLAAIRNSDHPNIRIWIGFVQVGRD